ncbi:hypothetical protein ACHAQJ_000162 [Trichoderma viride]
MTKEANCAQQRRRACVPCTQAKRRCDKTRPSCQRCLDKEISCGYSSSRPYARRGGASSRAWTAITSELSIDSPASPLFNDDNNGYDENSYRKDADTIINPQCVTCPWFLRVERWVIHHSEEMRTPPIIRSSTVQQYIRCVKKWLLQWVESNHCPMIHKSLFADTGMPPCLQDAYAALAVYSFKNEHNEDVVMQHIENKANALIQEHIMDTSPPIDAFTSAASPLSTAQHLARVLSLLIYQFIRLFDGHIRQRAQAEKQIPVMDSWTAQLWNSVSLDVTVQNTFGGDYLTVQDKAEAASKLWHSWILMENVRRVWMVSTYTRCIYLVSRDGNIDCCGAIDFTARHGLWDAASAAIWLRILEHKDPLFVEPYHADWLLEAITANDIDVFSLATMSLTLDSDKIDSWIANTKNTHLEALMAA